MTQVLPTATSLRSEAMTTTAVDVESSLQGMLAWAIALAVAAGGLIHLEAAIDHRDLTVIAIGFTAMGISQLLFAGALVIRPSLPVVVAAGALHAAILLTWILSRTVGVPFIPGAESAALVGVADVVANTFSVAAIAATIIGITLYRSSETVTLPPRTSRAMRAVMLAGAIILTVAALSETHHHARHDEAPSAQGHEHVADLSTPSHDSPASVSLNHQQAPRMSSRWRPPTVAVSSFSRQRVCSARVGGRTGGLVRSSG